MQYVLLCIYSSALGMLIELTPKDVLKVGFDSLIVWSSVREEPQKNVGVTSYHSAHPVNSDEGLIR